MGSKKIIEAMTKELSLALIALEKAQAVEEKVQQSIIVKNLSQALAVFFSMPGDFQAGEIDKDDEAEIDDLFEGKFA